IVLIALGLLVRLRIGETPAFDRIKATRREASIPVIEVLRRHPREVLLAIGLRLAENGGFYIYTVFILVYWTAPAGLDRTSILTGVLLGSAAMLLALPACGALSDRLGRRPIYLFGACMTAICAYPLFRIIDSGSAPLVWFALVFVLAFAQSPMYGP